MGRSAPGRRVEPLCRLIRFEATDRVPLAGLLYEPGGRSRPPVLLWLHGTGGASIFESARTNLMARTFLDRRVAFFPFNNRGAQFVRRAGRSLGGSAFERIRHCVRDIDGAIRELRRRGFRDFTLAGHSTGANKVALFDHFKRRSAVRRYVLVGGADDTGLLYDELGSRRFHALLRKARGMPPNALMPDRLMSWRAFYDMANPNGHYNVFPFHEAIRGRRPFRHVRGIRKPALYVYGENDEYGFDAPLLARNIGPRGEIVVVRGADHGFTGREHELAALISTWMASRAG